jgi:hypothetical protein
MSATATATPSAPPLNAAAAAANAATKAATAAAAAVTTTAEKSTKKAGDFIKTFADMLDSYPGAGLREVIRLIPDGLFIGTGLFGLMSQNFPVAMLFLALFETLLITVGLQTLFGYISFPDVIPTGQSSGENCVSGFQSPTLQTLSIFFKMGATSGFPSPPIFVFTTAVIYVLSCLQKFIPEMEGLGPGFSARYYMSIVLSSIALAIIVIFRLLTKCDSFGIIVLSVLAGFVLGIVLCQQNTTLFGKEAANLMGIPMFNNTTADGKPIYICPQKLVPRS